MARKPFILLFIVPMLVACSKQELAPARAASTAEDSQLSSVSVPGVLYVKFADILSDVVEESSAKGKLHTRSLDLNTSFDEVGVTSCTRLFPFAGEFEERTRKDTFSHYQTTRQEIRGNSGNAFYGRRPDRNKIHLRANAT